MNCIENNYILYPHTHSDRCITNHACGSRRPFWSFREITVSAVYTSAYSPSPVLVSKNGGGGRRYWNPPMLAIYLTLVLWPVLVLIECPFPCTGRFSLLNSSALAMANHLFGLCGLPQEKEGKIWKYNLDDWNWHSKDTFWVIGVQLRGIWFTLQ